MSISARSRTAPIRRRPSRSVPAIQAVASLAAALLLAGCGSSTGTGTPASAAQPSGAVSEPSGAVDQPSGAPGLPDGGLAAAALQAAYVDVVKTVSPSVVVIEASGGLGSGVVFDAQGNIVTNAHVVGDATQFTVTLADGRRLPATLVGTFPGNDVAVVRVKASDLHPATFADSSALVVGDIALAVGNPLGLQSSVTDGIVSALGRTVSEPGGVALPNMIQTSAPINPGNSGGALVDLSAHVIGIPTLTAVDPQIGGAAIGIGFAIPSNTVTDIARQLIASGHVTQSHRAYLGIVGATLTGVEGVLVHDVVPNGPAAKAGIVPGDIITAVGGQPTPSSEELASVLAGMQPGQSVPVSIVKPDGTSTTVNVTLGQLPG